MFAWFWEKFGELSLLSGASDVIVVQHEDGSLHASPFHVRFGRLQVLRAREKVIKVYVNEVTKLKMVLDNEGVATFRYTEPSSIVGATPSMTQHPVALERPESVRPAAAHGVHSPPATPEINAPRGAFNNRVQQHQQTSSSSPSSPPSSSRIVAAGTGAGIGEDELGGRNADPELEVDGGSALPSPALSRTPSKRTKILSSIRSLCSAFSPARSSRLRGDIAEGNAGYDEGKSGEGSAHAREPAALPTTSSSQHPAAGAHTGASMPVLPAAAAAGATPSHSTVALSHLLVGESVHIPPSQPQHVVSADSSVSSSSSPYFSASPQHGGFDIGSGNGVMANETNPTGDTSAAGRKGAAPTNMLPSAAPATLSSSADAEPWSLQGLVTPARLIARDVNPHPPTRDPHGDVHAQVHGQRDQSDVDAALPANADGSSLSSPSATKTVAKSSSSHLSESGPVNSEHAHAYSGGPAAEDVDSGAGGASAPTASMNVPAASREAPAATATANQIPATVTRLSLVPTQEELASLGLRPGHNSITYSVVSTLQGEQSVGASIYLFPRSAKLVVCDIDGTITRSDVFGQILPVMGKDWSQPGVARFFSLLHARNGYQVVYLSARSLVQANATRDFLEFLRQPHSESAGVTSTASAPSRGASSAPRDRPPAEIRETEPTRPAVPAEAAATATPPCANQDSPLAIAAAAPSATAKPTSADASALVSPAPSSESLNASSTTVTPRPSSNADFRLPPGPLLLSPDGLMDSFLREVVYRRPQDVKILTLSVIKALFTRAAPHGQLQPSLTPAAAPPDAAARGPSASHPAPGITSGPPTSTRADRDHAQPDRDHGHRSQHAQPQPPPVQHHDSARPASEEDHDKHHHHFLRRLSRLSSSSAAPHASSFGSLPDPNAATSGSGAHDAEIDIDPAAAAADRDAAAAAAHTAAATAAAAAANPLFAGFGNRHSDWFAYAAVGIPPHRIFIIDSSGHISTPAAAHALAITTTAAAAASETAVASVNAATSAAILAQQPPSAAAAREPGESVSSVPLRASSPSRCPPLEQQRGSGGGGDGSGDGDGADGSGSNGSVVGLSRVAAAALASAAANTVFEAASAAEAELKTRAKAGAGALARNQRFAIGSSEEQLQEEPAHAPAMVATVESTSETAQSLAATAPANASLSAGAVQAASPRDVPSLCAAAADDTGHASDGRETKDRPREEAAPAALGASPPAADGAQGDARDPSRSPQASAPSSASASASSTYARVPFFFLHPWQSLRRALALGRARRHPVASHRAQSENSSIVLSSTSPPSSERLNDEQSHQSSPSGSPLHNSNTADEDAAAASAAAATRSRSGSAPETTVNVVTYLSLSASEAGIDSLFPPLAPSSAFVNLTTN